MSGFLGQAVKSTYRNHSLQAVIKRSCTTKTTAAPPAGVKDVPGLSNKIVSVPTSDVGPGASKKSDYKNPEYFCYNNTSYFEAEVEMLKYRLPQPISRSDNKK